MLFNTTDRFIDFIAAPVQNPCVGGPYVFRSGVLEPGTMGFEPTHLFGNPVDSGASFGDFTTQSPVSEGSYMTDSFQTLTETYTSRNFFEPTAFADSVYSAATLETPSSPSRWVPASPQLQKHLNRVYAPQLARLAADPTSPPVLYFPAEEAPVSPMPSVRSQPNDDLARTDVFQTPQIDAEPLSIDPSLLMPMNAAASVSLPLSNGEHHLMSPIPNAFVPDAEGQQTSTPTNKRAFDANNSVCESAPKRTLTTKQTPNAINNTDSNNDQGAALTRAESARHSSLPNVATNESFTNESDAEGDDDPDYHTPSLSPDAKQNSYSRYEQTSSEIHTRDKRLNERNTRRVSSVKDKRERRNRKMKKLLGEIKDTKEFKAATGGEGGENEGGDEGEGRRRPVRKGARKCYVGLQ